MKKQTATLIANIFNPLFMGGVLILVVSFYSTTTLFDGIRWSLILLALSVLPTYLTTLYLVRTGHLDGVFSSRRRQRNKVYAIIVLLGIISLIVLIYFRSPLMLIALCVVGFSSSVLYATINLWWKISLHAAFVSATATILIILYGPVAAVSVVLIPLVVWARKAGYHHSVSQGVAGAFLTTADSLLVFYLFGLL